MLVVSPGRGGTGLGSSTLPGPCPVSPGCSAARSLRALTAHTLCFCCWGEPISRLLNLCQMMCCRTGDGGRCPGRQVCGPGGLVPPTGTRRLLMPLGSNGSHSFLLCCARFIMRCQWLSPGFHLSWTHVQCATQMYHPLPQQISSITEKVFQSK